MELFELEIVDVVKRKEYFRSNSQSDAKKKCIDLSRGSHSYRMRLKDSSGDEVWENINERAVG